MATATGPAGKHTHHIGHVQVSRVYEQPLPLPPAALIPDFDPAVLKEHWELMVPDHYDAGDDKLLLGIHSWVLQTGRHTIVIDSCVGNDKQRPAFPQFHNAQNPYLERLEEAGIRPEAVNYVFCTHLHVDHVGWNTRLQDGRWVPTFPNAKYVFSKSEHEYWSGPAGKEGPNAGVYEDSVLPVVEAGLAEIIDGAAELPCGLVLQPTPGHTPGHVAVTLAAGGNEALFTGDIMHSPIQVCRPHWNSGFCGEPEKARASRLWALEYAAERRAAVFTAHFGGKSAGRVARTPGGFTWTGF
ncbi:MAG TPA: MBL fold metallo-hydrolase [Bryobacteraceae bacterium]|nr:MBL fold metallo-hydrolase [Bryobacteraceae bacterium]